MTRATDPYTALAFVRQRMIDHLMQRDDPSLREVLEVTESALAGQLAQRWLCTGFLSGCECPDCTAQAESERRAVLDALTGMG